MEWGVIQGILSLGVGGVLAIVIFVMYRRDKNATVSMLSDMLDRVLDTIERHTEAITELSVLLRKMNGKS